MGFIVATDLTALRHNVEKIKAETGKLVMLMAKCDAYGRGARGVSKFAEAYVDAFGVATAKEGEKLRSLGVKKPILVTMFENQDALIAAKCDLDVGVYTTKQVELLEAAAEKMQKSLNVHIAVNTGMNRLGVCEKTSLLELLDALKRARNVFVKGVYTHFYGTDRESVKLQSKRFIEYESAVKSSFGEILTHTQNSGALSYDAPGSMVRVGLSAYGDIDGFVPTMSVYGKIISVCKVAPGDAVGYGRSFVMPDGGDVAVVSGGYGDGLSFGQEYVLINGKRVKIVCNPCMDVFMADVTGTGAKVGDAVTVIGRSGKEEITLSDVAKREGTSPYAVATAFGGRIDRVYFV